MMELGTIVMVDHPRHPFHGCVGKVVGRRGNRTPDDMWILIYFASKMRSYLVPESILSTPKTEITPADQPLH
jgi:ribosomal protein L21E